MFAAAQGRVCATLMAVRVPMRALKTYEGFSMKSRPQLASYDDEASPTESRKDIPLRFARQRVDGSTAPFQRCPDAAYLIPCFSPLSR